MTQLLSALIGNFTPELIKIAEKEQINKNVLQNLVALGQVVIPHNTNRHSEPCGIGRHLSTKVNANLGTSEMHICVDEEIAKLRCSENFGAHSIMDLSTGGDLKEIRKRFLKETKLIVGTVPIYAVAAELQSKGRDITGFEPEMLFEEIEMQAEQGVDFMTVHAGICLRSLAFERNSKRLLGIVSRGGSLLKRWMLQQNKENPLYEDYDRLLKICLKHDVTLSLGDGFRPGAISDATDRTQVSELLVLGELVQRAREAGVQVIVEGPGHVPIQDIEANVILQKKLCDNAPFYVLGPLPTDFASGYDHITGAIGGAIAGSAGADFLCYVTPAEHLCLPTIEDVKLGVISSRIAAHISDIAKDYPGTAEIDNTISQARREMDWENVFKHSVDPDYARKRKQETTKDKKDYCSMCGNLCAIKTDKQS